MIHPLCKYSNAAKLRAQLNKQFFLLFQGRASRLDDCMFCVYFILPDRQGVQEHSTIDRLQENLALTLKTSIECKRSGPEKRWGPILLPSRINKEKKIAQQYNPPAFP